LRPTKQNCAGLFDRARCGASVAPQLFNERYSKYVDAATTPIATAAPLLHLRGAADIPTELLTHCF
jgi:hypothetical protein